MEFQTAVSCYRYWQEANFLIFLTQICTVSATDYYNLDGASTYICFNRNCRFKDKMVSRPSYLYDGIFYVPRKDCLYIETGPCSHQRDIFMAICTTSYETCILRSLHWHGNIHGGHASHVTLMNIGKSFSLTTKTYDITQTKSTLTAN